MGLNIFQPYENCPWDQCIPATKDFLETAPCAWIKEPCNTWSNLAYILIGVYILWRYRRDAWKPIKFLGFMAIALGITSGLYHASCILTFQAMDLASMYLITTLLITLNLRRIGFIKKGEVYRIFWGLFLVSTAIFVSFRSHGRLVFTIHVFAVIFSELHLYLSRRNHAEYRDMFRALSLFALSYVVWFLDVKGLISNPDNHYIQGHALWHVLSAFSILFLYRFYDQFPIYSVRRERIITAWLGIKEDRKAWRSLRAGLD